MTTPRTHYSVPNNFATVGSLPQSPDSTMHFALDGHIVTREAFYGQGLPDHVVVRKSRIQSVSALDLRRNHRLYADGTTLADVDSAYRTIKHVRWMLENEEGAVLQPDSDDVAKYMLVSMAADEYDRQQRSDEMLALLGRAGIAFAAAVILGGFSGFLLPAALRPAATGWGAIIGLGIAIVIFAQGGQR